LKAIFFSSSYTKADFQRDFEDDPDEDDVYGDDPR
jgi:hypothetical protein